MGIKRFQEDAVRAAMAAFQDKTRPQPPRYLVADETGLGKTNVAAGVIAELWRQRDPAKPFIVYYFGSNSLLLNETMDKLRRHIGQLVGGEDIIQVFETVDRLSLVALKTIKIQQRMDRINLFAFSANLLDNTKSKQGNENERNAIETYLREKALKKIKPENAEYARYLSAWKEKRQEFAQIKSRLARLKPTDVGYAALKKQAKALQDKNKTLEQKAESLRMKVSNAEIDAYVKLLNDPETHQNQDLVVKGRLQTLVETYRGEMQKTAFLESRPAVVICDEFHRYADKLKELEKLNETTPQLYLSATPYNWIGLDWKKEDYEGLESESTEAAQKLGTFQDLLKELKAAQVDQTDSAALKQHIYRNERPGAARRYEEIPPRETLQDYKDCLEYHRQVLTQELGTTPYFRQAPGVYSFADFHAVLDKTKETAGYKDLRDSLEARKSLGLPIPEDWFLFDDAEEAGVLKKEELLRHLKLRVIHDTQFEAGKQLLWVPPSKPLYPLGGSFHDNADFSKLLIFSGYTMVPRIVAAVFSALVPVGTGSNQFTELDNAVREGGLLRKLTALYDGSERPSAQALLAEVRQKLIRCEDLRSLIGASGGSTRLAMYVIAGPACCILRTMQTPDEEKAWPLAEQFGAYLGKLSSICGESLEQQLQYCMDGNLQAMLYEYAFLHHDWADKLGPILAYSGSTVHVRTATYYERPTVQISCLFADRLTPDGEDTNVTETTSTGKAHHTAVKNAFNSPFWPMILTTTSSGQEGIDLDGYCRRIMHYSVPASPMAFEQRDGRIDRFRSLLTRKCMVQMEEQGTFHTISNGAKYWSALFEENQALHGMSPDWVPNGYDGKLKLQRVIAFFPYSSEDLAYRALLRCCDKYRSHFGQPPGDSAKASIVLNDLQDP